MNTSKLSSSTLGIIVTIAVTIFPATQLILLTLNGGLTYILAIPFGATTKSNEISSLVVNSILVIPGLVIFYSAKKTWVTIVSTFLIMFSGQMLMLFISDELNGGDNYFLGWLTVAGVPTLVILILGLAKHYTRHGITEKVG